MLTIYKKDNTTQVLTIRPHVFFNSRGSKITKNEVIQNLGITAKAIAGPMYEDHRIEL